ncbi:CHAD domain-containing protein [Methanolobus sp. ZRKC5]|uniref:CHAD domain-containing protein n=1 Tax=Methanolobus sp. ZRKC5 TaxID=3136295 RepID=UPI00313B201B
MSSNMLVKKYSLVASLGFLFGLVFCMTGLLFAMVSRLSRNSSPEVILTVCFLLGAGILFILAGIILAGMRQRFSRSYSFITGILLSVTGLLIFTFSFPESWTYPKVSYVIMFYSVGIFLLLINIFVNYFLQAFTGTETQATVAQKQKPDISNEYSQFNDRSVLATFAGIMVTNITSGSYEPSFLTDTNGRYDHFIVNDKVSEEKQPEPQIMGQTEETMIPEKNTIHNPSINAEMKENVHFEDDSFNEPTAMETTQFPEIVDVLETEDNGLPEDGSDENVEPTFAPVTETRGLSTTVVPVIPFSEFRSLEKTNIKATDTMREAAHKILMFHFGVMIEHERGTKVGKDIEELHDMRVAAMRMRSAVEVLENYLEMKKMFSHYKNVKTTRRVLGSVRDLDVFLEKIEHYLEDKPPESRAEMDPLVDSILIEKAKQRGSMLVYLDDVKYNKFKKNFAAYLLNKKFWKMKSVKKNREPVPGRVMDVLPVLLYTQFAAVRAYEELVSDETMIDPDIEKYHQLRIDVKILRYTLEFFREALGSESRDLIKDLKALQDNLGDMHDTVVALELLGNFEKYGRWGETDKKKVPVSNGLGDYPGVDAYMEYKKQDLQNLMNSFPEVWSRVIDPDFSIRFSQAVAGIYNS